MHDRLAIFSVCNNILGIQSSKNNALDRFRGQKWTYEWLSRFIFAGADRRWSFSRFWIFWTGPFFWPGGRIGGNIGFGLEKNIRWDTNKVWYSLFIISEFWFDIWFWLFGFDSFWFWRMVRIVIVSIRFASRSFHTASIGWASWFAFYFRNTSPRLHWIATFRIRSWICILRVALLFHLP